MPIINIAGKQVHVEEGSESAEYAAKYLSKNPDNAKGIFAEAELNHEDHTSHYEVPNMHNSEDRSIAHHVTMIHNSDGTYTLQKRHGY